MMMKRSKRTTVDGNNIDPVAENSISTAAQTTSGGGGRGGR